MLPSLTSSASPLSERNHQHLQLIQMWGQTGAGFRVSDEQRSSPVGHHHQSTGGKTTSGVRNKRKNPDSTDVWSDFRQSWWASAFSQWWMSWWWRNQAAALKRSVSWFGLQYYICITVNYPSLDSYFLLQMLRKRHNGSVFRADSQQAVKSPPLLVRSGNAQQKYDF